MSFIPKPTSLPFNHDSAPERLRRWFQNPLGSTPRNSNASLSHSLSPFAREGAAPGVERKTIRALSEFRTPKKVETS